MRHDGPTVVAWLTLWLSTEAVAGYASRYASASGLGYDRHKPKPNPIALADFDADQESMFLRNAAKAKTYFEFGCGGSTRHVLDRTDVPEVVAVDSMREWLDRVASFGYYGSRLTTIHVDIGRTRAFGNPLNFKRRDFWPDYPGAISKYPHADVVLVDGRFRVACVAAALLYTKPGTVIMFHDFWERTSYHIILPLVDVLETAGELLVCRAKRGLPREAAQRLFDAYKYDYDIHDRLSEAEVEELKNQLTVMVGGPGAVEREQRIQRQERARRMREEDYDGAVARMRQWESKRRTMTGR